MVLQVEIAQTVTIKVSVLLTGELYWKPLFADEVVGIKLQRQNVEGGVDILRQGWTGPLLEQDTPVRRPWWSIPNSQDVVAHLGVKDDEVEAEGT